MDISNQDKTELYDSIINKNLELFKKIINSTTIIAFHPCIYNDLEVAKIMFKTKDFDINRIDISHQIGAIRLIEESGNDVVDMIELLIEKGLDINYRYDLKTNTLLESFIYAIDKNYKAIEILVKYCADIHATTTRHTDRHGQLLNIDEYVKNY